MDCVIVSPHVDDAFLSLGGLLSKKQFGTALVLNLFSQSKYAKPRYGDSVKEIGKERRREELINAAAVGCAVEFSGLPEAGLRGYQIGADGKIWGDNPSRRDIEVAIEAERRILDRIRDAKDVFFPLAIGRHVDHMIVSKIGIETATRKNSGLNFHFYEDMPYAIHSPSRAGYLDIGLSGHQMHPKMLRFNPVTKFRLCSNYISQFNQYDALRIVLYGKQMRVLGGFNERIWSVNDYEYLGALATKEPIINGAVREIRDKHQYSRLTAKGHEN
ncbi:MAG: PIG-L family deacetylase [Nitrososphaerota archaeon]|nr:PIG-L family deacetylase [Nitrososphaerota archaeon]MDG7014923.1 PIG-L family deacetylase [Nitrososphaerota archaeon]WGO50883.1 MAG: PIG-L family deacetylase [Nitrososphaerota archaeon]